jgi:rod shape-determining protein MreC
MSRLFSSLYPYRQITALAVSLIVSVLLLSLSQQQQVQISRTVMLTVFAPLQDVFSFLPLSLNLRRENETLREAVLQLKLENATLQESLNENDRLRRMLGLKKRAAFSYIPAEVIARDPGRGLNTVVIDVGTRSGIGRYMAVVTTEGLAGRVAEAGPVSSIVQLLTDANCRVSGVVQRSRAQGSISWQAETGLDMRLPVRSDIRIGDHIVTSGLGGTFPPGLVIGQVERIELEDMGLFKRAFVQPAADLARLEEVFVISPKPTDGGTEYRMSDRTTP